LGHVISADGLKMDPIKLKAIEEWDCCHATNVSCFDEHSNSE
jgi:hypothetical protein